MSDDSERSASQTGQDAEQEAPPSGNRLEQNQPTGEPDAAALPQARTDVPQADDPTRETVSRAELEKVIAQRQTAKARARKAEHKLVELEAELRAAASGADAPPDDGDGSGTPEEAIRQENSRLKRQLTSLLRDQGLRAAAAAVGAVNPDQVVALLRPRVEMDVDADGRLVPKFVDGQGRLIAQGDGKATDMQSFVALFLSLPENANLVKADTVPGSGARPAGGARWSEARPRSLEEFNGLPEEQRMRWALEMGPEKLRTLLGIGQIHDQGFL